MLTKEFVGDISFVFVEERPEIDDEFGVGVSE
jgi:hypothetical protein